MADQDQASIESTPEKVLDPVPVTPSRETERPAGLAFDVEQGADLPGAPAGDQTPRNPGAAPAQEMGGGVSEIDVFNPGTMPEAVTVRLSLPSGPLAPLTDTDPWRERPIASSSSMNTIAGAASLALAKRSRTREAPTPTIASMNSAAEIEKKAA